jgi:hypothetical protein
MKSRLSLPLAASLVCATLSLSRPYTSQESSPNTPKEVPVFRREDHPYHQRPAKGALPSPLDADQFRDKPQSYVAYKLAAQLSGLLYQQPCLCTCGKERGHKSLLDCFTGLHGRNCDECKVEVFFCHAQNKKGWSAKKIREAMFQFKFLDINFKEYARQQWQIMTEGSPDTKESRQ